MKGKSTKLSKITGRYLWIGVGLAGLFWIFESCVHVFAFNDAHFIHQMLAPEPHELWMRLIIVVLFVVFGIHAQQIIIQRMGAKDAMRESEQRYRTLFEGAAEGILVVDIGTKEFKYANPALSKMLGYSEDELVQLSVPDIHPPETLDHVISEFEAQARGEKTLATCIPCLRKDGTIIYADINTTKILIDERECNVGFFTDVTERKKIEDALRESEERYSLLINKIPSVTWITDEHGKTTFISPNVERVYGYNQQEVYEAGDSVWFGRIHPDDVELVRESFEMMLTKNQEYDVEYRIQRKDGAWIWLHDMTIMAFEKDNIRYAFGVFSDITERKRAEESLQASESRYRTLVENLPVKVFVKDKDSVYVSCNKSYALDLGIKPDEIAGRTDYDYYPEDLAEKYRSDDRRAMGSGQTEELEERYIRDGQELYVHTIKTSLKNEVGNVTGVLGVFWDITERKRVEDALRESEQRFRELAELLPVSVFELDVDGNFTYSNRCGFEMFGYTHEDLEKGMNALQLFIPEERQRVKQNIRKRLTGEEFKDHEYTVLKKDGSTLTVLINTAAITRNNKSIGVRGIVLDITERKRAEEALRESEDRFRAMFENMGSGVAVYEAAENGEDFIFRGFNSSAERITRISRNAALGSRLLDLFPYMDRSGLLGALQRVWKTGQAEHLPPFYYKDDIREGWRENRIYKLPSGEVVAIFDDVTERKQAEEAVREREETLRALLNAPTESAMLVDLEGTILAINQVGSQRLGISEDKLIGLRIFDYLPRDMAESRKAQGDKVVRTEKPLRFQDERAGRFYDINTYPVFDIDGKVKSLAIYASDITETKRAEDALRESEAKYRTLMEQIPAVTYMASLDEASTTQYISPQIETMTGFAQAEYRDNPDVWRQQIHTEDRDRVLAEVAHARKSEEPFISEYRMMTRDGGMVWFHDEAVVVYDVTGKPLCLQGVMFNITERKEAEDELKQSRQQLRDLSSHLQSIREEERTHIAREVHDDLGQALTALKLDIHWLANRLTDDQALLLEKTKSMSRLVDTTIHSVQRISSELRPGLLDDLGLSAAIEWLAGQFTGRSVIKCDFTSDPEEIVLDRDRSTAIFRIFQESLTNIARHANATRVEVSLKQKSDAIELKVTDDGKGITEEQISDPKSFGLIGMHERVHSLGGYLNISGTPNEGTTIMVGIPFNKEE